MHNKNRWHWYECKQARVA